MHHLLFNPALLLAPLTSSPCQVTYFYRWPDLVDAIEGSSNNTRRLAKALTNLGITEHEKDVEGLLKKRGCGRTPPNHFGMRYVSAENRVAACRGKGGMSGDV
jgi:hypothetical protein